MVFRAIVLKAVRSIIFPMLEELLDNQVQGVKFEVSEMDGLSDEGKAAVNDTIDRLVSRFKRAVSGTM